MLQISSFCWLAEFRNNGVAGSCVPSPVIETHDTADRRLRLEREDVVLSRDDEDAEVDLV